MAHGAPSRRHAPAPGRGFLRAAAPLIGPAAPREGATDWLAGLPVLAARPFKGGEEAERGVGFVVVRAGGSEWRAGTRAPVARGGGAVTRGGSHGGGGGSALHGGFAWLFAGGGEGGDSVSGILHVAICTAACVGWGLRVGGCVTGYTGGGGRWCCVHRCALLHAPRGAADGVCTPCFPPTGGEGDASGGLHAPSC